MTGPVPTVPDGWKWKGDKYPNKGEFRDNGYILVKPEDMPPEFPRPHAKTVPDTFFLVDKKKGRFVQLSTLIGGVYHGWTQCGICRNFASRCICLGGFIHTRGLEAISIVSRMRDAGVVLSDWGKIDYTSMYVRERALYWYVGKSSSEPSMDAAMRQRASRQASATRAAEAPSRKPEKRSLKRKGPQADVSKNYDSEASSSADAMTKALTRKLVQKSPEPKKRSLTRRK